MSSTWSVNVTPPGWFQNQQITTRIGGGAFHRSADLRPLLHHRGRKLQVPDERVDGVIVAEADATGGFSLGDDDRGLFHHSYSMMGVEQYHQVATEPLPTGDITVRMQFDADPQPRTAGDVTLYANRAKIGEGRVDQTVLLRFSRCAGMHIGRDNGLPVDPAYSQKSPDPFAATVEESHLRPPTKTTPDRQTAPPSPRPRCRRR